MKYITLKMQFSYTLTFICFRRETSDSRLDLAQVWCGGKLRGGQQ